LVGVKTEGQLGGTSEFKEAFQIFQNTYIISRRKIIETVYNKLSKARGQGEVTIGQIEAPGEPQTPDVPEVQPTQERSQMSSLVPKAEEVEGLMKIFDEYGVKREQCNVHKKRRVLFSTDDDAEVSEYEFQDELNALERGVIDLLVKDPLMEENVMARTLKSNVRDVQAAVGSLTTKGLLTVTQVQSGDPDAPEGLSEPVTKRFPVKEARDLIREEEVKTENIEVRYSYEVDARFGAPIIEGTRDFCRQLLGLDKLFTRKEIETISGRVNRNVWQFRGGWKTSKSGVRTPFCRHIWMQNIVTVK